MADGWLRWSAPAQVALLAGGRHSILLLLQALQPWQLGFSVSVYLLSRNHPKYTPTQLLLVPDSFFACCCSRRGVSRCKHCSKGSQDVSHPHTVLMGKDSRPGGLSAHCSHSLSLNPPASRENGKAGGEKSF